MKLFTKLLLVVLSLLSLQVFSHSKLISSEPADQAQLTEIPRQIVLNFDKKVHLLKFELSNSAQQIVAINFQSTPDKSSAFTVKLPGLEADTYQVKWIAMSGDSHKIKGAFSFSVLAAGNRL